MTRRVSSTSRVRSSRGVTCAGHPWQASRSRNAASSAAPGGASGIWESRSSSAALCTLECCRTSSSARWKPKVCAYQMTCWSSPYAARWAPASRQGVLHEPQVRDQFLGVAVGVLGAARPGCAQPFGDDQHALAVGFCRGPGVDLGEAFGHRHRVAFQRLGQRPRRRGVAPVGGQRPAHPLDRHLQGRQRVVCLQRQRPAGHVGGDMRVAVPVPAHPRAEPDEGRYG